MRRWAFSTFFVCALAAAQEPDPQAQQATQVLTRYLTQVKSKQWAEARKSVHPKTLEALAERKKRLGKEDHPMAPQAIEKTESYLKEFKVTGTRPGPPGTFLVETSEDNYQVQEKGLSEGDVATYLLGRFQGKWYVVDKKRGGETFTKASVKYGYKGYFDLPEPDAQTHAEEQ